MRGSILLLFWTVGLFAQSTPVPNQQKAPAIAGLETPWDARKIVAQLAQDNDKLRPILQKINPQRWYDEKGAPSTYIVQLQAAQQQLRDVDVTTQLLQQKIDSLSAALDVYFRLEALESTARSLEEGAQRYADRATADQLAQFIAQNFTTRERFRDYIKDLASNTEQNFKIADEEAQRCRANLMSQPPPQKNSRKK